MTIYITISQGEFPSTATPILTTSNPLVTEATILSIANHILAARPSMGTPTATPPKKGRVHPTPMVRVCNLCMEPHPNFPSSDPEHTQAVITNLLRWLFEYHPDPDPPVLDSPPQ